MTESAGQNKIRSNCQTLFHAFKKQLKVGLVDFYICTKLVVILMLI